jgi:hypothetical protein
MYSYYLRRYLLIVNNVYTYLTLSFDFLYLMLLGPKRYSCTLVNSLSSMD